MNAPKFLLPNQSSKSRKYWDSLFLGFDSEPYSFAESNASPEVLKIRQELLSTVVDAILLTFKISVDRFDPYGRSGEWRSWVHATFIVLTRRV